MLGPLALALCFCILSLPLVRRRNKQIVISVDNILVAAFIVLFSVMFPFVYAYSLYGSSTRDYLVEYIAKYTLSQMCIYYLVSYLFLFVLVFCYRRVAGHASIEDVLKRPAYSLGSSRTFLVATVCLWLIGAASDVLYLWEYGGYATYMEYAGQIRSGASDFYNPFSFLMPFRDCVPLASLFLFSLISRKRPYVLPMFIVAFSHALLIYYSNRGRLGFVLFLVIFPLFYMVRRFRLKAINARLVAMCLLFVVLFLVLIVGLGNLLSRNTAEGVLQILAEETSFFFANFKVILDNDIDYRFFFDIITYPVYLLPSSIWRTFIPNTVSDLMTIMIDGHKKGEGGVYGEAPIDAIGLSYFQLGIVGVVVCAAVWGILLALVFRMAKRIRHRDSSLMIHTYLVVSLALRSVLYCDTYNVVQRMFPLVVFVCIYIVLALLTPRRQRVSV